MFEVSLLPFSFRVVERKKVTAAFDGGHVASDGGVMLLAPAEKALGIANRIASLITDPRNPLLVTRRVAMRMATISTTRTPAPASGGPADVCLAGASICAHSQPLRE
jgi:hypothetical protein